MKLWHGIIVALGLSIALPSLAESLPSETAEQTIESSAPNGNDEIPLIEVSFGNSQLFSGSLNEAVTGELGSYVPARSSLFLIEILRVRWSGICAINIPLSGQPTLSDGVLTEMPIAPSMSLGFRWSAVVVPLGKRAVVEAQVAAMAGRSVGSTQGDIFFPLFGGRLHVSRPNGFTMYLGSMFTLKRETLALIYGVGNKF